MTPHPGDARLRTTSVIGAERYERTETRTTQRNGGRNRVLSTKAGDVEVRIPKLRQGSFLPSLLRPVTHRYLDFGRRRDACGPDDLGAAVAADATPNPPRAGGGGW